MEIKRIKGKEHYLYDSMDEFMEKMLRDGAFSEGSVKDVTIRVDTVRVKTHIQNKVNNVLKKYG